MSLETRIREGLEAEAREVVPDVEAHLAATRRQVRRARLVRTAALAAAAVVAAVAVPLTVRALGDDEAAPVVPAQLTRDEAHALLQDTWVTYPVTRNEVAEVLRSAGLSEHTDTVTLEAGFPSAWALRLRPERYLLSSASGVLQDEGTWAVRGADLVLRPTGCAPCEIRFRWSVRVGDDDELLLRFLSDTSPSADGVPDEAYARALYGTVPFTRYDPADARR